jgi:hypothetical protein
MTQRKLNERRGQKSELNFRCTSSECDGRAEFSACDLLSGYVSGTGHYNWSRLTRLRVSVEQHRRLGNKRSRAELTT